MIGRREFFRRASGQAAALAVLSPEELIKWHDDRIADDFYDELGDEYKLNGYPVDFELIGVEGRLPGRSDAILDSVVKGWDDGVQLAGSEGRGRRFVLVLCAIREISVHRIRYRVRDGGLVEGCGWRDEWLTRVNLGPGEELQVTANLQVVWSDFYA